LKNHSPFRCGHFLVDSLERRLLFAVPQFTDFVVTEPTSQQIKDQWEPSVALGPSGVLLVAWSATQATASEQDIHARFFNNDGTPLSEEFQVNDVGTEDGVDSQRPSVAVNNSGDYVIAWEGFVDADGPKVIVGEQLSVDTSGIVSEGADFQMSRDYGLLYSSTVGAPSVGIDDAGYITVTFTNEFTADLDDVSTFGYEARFDLFAGTTRIGEFYAASGNAVPALPNTGKGETASRNYSNSVVAVNARGDIAIAWNADDAEAETSNTWGIFGDAIPIAGTAIFNHQINSTEADDQIYPSIGMDSNGNFAASWTSGTDLSISSLQSVRARRFTLGFSPRVTGGSSGDFRVDPAGNDVWLHITRLRCKWELNRCVPRGAHGVLLQPGLCSNL
jgi:hypothetical protein